MKDNLLPNIIKVGAVLTAAPRWIGALLAAEGFPLPAEWLVWWIPVSAGLSACMAIVEGLAFAYVFEAWRNQKDVKSNLLFWFAIISAVVFVLVLAPYIAASVKHVTVYAMLYNDILLYVWSILVGLSTIAIVASVGYAQKARDAKPKADPPATHSTAISDNSALVCSRCGYEARSEMALRGHMRKHSTLLAGHSNGRVHETVSTRGQ